jgi:hypothetical protein
MAKVIISFDTFEDRDELDMYMNAPRMHKNASDALNYIRSEIKYKELSDETVAALERVRDILYIPED